MLLDSNIIIYAAQPQHEFLREYLSTIPMEVSAISKVETLGYSALSEEEKEYLEEFFRMVVVLPLEESVLNRATLLRQQRKMSLGDALIAGTALAYNLTLITRNTQDFRWVDGLKLIDPFKKDSTSD